MPKKTRPSNKPRPGRLRDYVPAVFARSLDEAERYRQLLEDHDVPAVIDGEYCPPRPRGAPGECVPVLVPEPLLEDAKGFIADIEETNGFLEDEEDYLDACGDPLEDDEFDPDDEDREF
jgi:hypothetical protein